jgi:hypothetical protein
MVIMPICELIAHYASDGNWQDAILKYAAHQQGMTIHPHNNCVVSDSGSMVAEFRDANDQPHPFMIQQPNVNVVHVTPILPAKLAACMYLLIQTNVCLDNVLLISYVDFIVNFGNWARLTFSVAPHPQSPFYTEFGRIDQTTILMRAYKQNKDTGEFVIHCDIKYEGDPSQPLISCRWPWVRLCLL